MKRQILIDLETLDTADTAIICSIGAVEFDIASNTITRQFYRTLDISAQLFTRTTSRDTIDWWAKQSPEARNQLLWSPLRPLIALNLLLNFLPPANTYDLWANSPSFDCNILAHILQQNDLIIPWSFRDERCYRTIMATHPLSEEEKPAFQGIRHHAFHDAQHEARCLMTVLRSHWAPTLA